MALCKAKLNTVKAFGLDGIKFDFARATIAMLRARFLKNEV